MATDRKQSDITAPREAWKLLGELLEARRQELGYRYRTQFERDRGLNKRMAADIEKAYESRINTFPPATLRRIARLYEVTYESMRAVLDGQAEKLAPAAPAVPDGPPGLLPPAGGPGREDAVRPYHDAINEQRVRLAARGITDPSGAQMFPDSPDDAKAWDGIGARLPINLRLWFIAELRLNESRRGPGPGAGSGTASA